MRIQYSPEIGLHIIFDMDEIQIGVELVEGACDMYEDNGADTSEVRVALEAITNVRLTLN